MFTVRAPNRSHSGISAGVSFTAGVGYTDNQAALAYFRRAGYEIVPGGPAPGPVPGPVPGPTPSPVPAAAPTITAPGGEPSPFDPGGPAMPAPVGKPLERMNKAELQAIAAELGLDAEGTNRELVSRIRAARAGA